MAHSVEDSILSVINEQVPKLFSGDDPQFNLSENMLTEFTMKLEHIFSVSDDPEHLFQKLLDASGGSTVCGAVFEAGDIFYCCLDCQTDPTCCLCEACYLQSEHVSHNYRMLTSAGAGCCDCGDMEAWKQFHHCETHKPQSQHTDQDPLSILPPWLIAHATEFFKAIFRYCLVIQTSKSLQSISFNYQHCFSQDERYCLMIFNDEVNTFDAVKETFVNILNLTPQESVKATCYIDSVGRAKVFVGTEKECRECETKIISKLGLETLVIPLLLAQHQECSVYLLKTTLSIAKKTPGLQKLCTMVLFNKDDVFSTTQQSSISLIQFLFASYPKLWLTTCDSWMTILIQIILPLEYGKKLLTEYFMRNYKLFIKQMEDNRDKPNLLLHQLSVQLFTSPSASLYAIQDCNGLPIIIELMYSYITSKGKVKRPITSDKIADVLQSSVRTFSFDLKYLLRQELANVQWSDQLRNSFLTGFQQYMNILSVFEGCDPHKKSAAIHVFYEVNWRNCFQMQRLLQPVTLGFIKWLSSDKIMLTSAIDAIFSVLAEIYPAKEYPVRTCKVFDKFYCEGSKWDINTNSVSCHQPLTRLLTALLGKLYINGMEFNQLSQIDIRCKKLWLLERPLTSLIFKAQVENQMWKKNGVGVANAITNYHNFMCNEMYFRDIGLLQIMSNLLPPRTILMSIMHKYGTGDWFDSSYCKKKLTSDVLLTMQQLVEETLTLFITVLIDRNNPDIGMLTEEQSIEQRIINILFLDSWAHSDFEKELYRGNVSFDHTSDPIVDSLLTKFSDISRNNKSTKFTLKTEFYNRVSIFFYHDSMENFSKAIEKRKSLSKTSPNDAFLVSSPPNLPNFRPHLCGVLELLNNDVIIAILSEILDRALHSKEFVSEFIVQQALFIIALGIAEDIKKSNTDFISIIRGLRTLRNTHVNFIPLFNELKKCQDYEESFHLLNWITSKLFPQQEFNTPDSIVNHELTQAEKNKELAKKRQEEMRMMMLAKQRSFLAHHESFNENENPIINQSNESSATPSNFDIPIIGIGTHCLRHSPSLQQQDLNCMICHAPTTASTNEAASTLSDMFVLPVHISLSTMLNKMSGTFSGSDLSCHDISLPNTNLKVGLLAKSCGHALHFSCYEQHTKNSQTIFNNRGESYVCPLCSDNSNTILPVSQTLQFNATQLDNILEPTFDQFLTLLVRLKKNNYNLTRIIVLECGMFSQSLNIYPMEANSAHHYNSHLKLFQQLPKKAANVGYNNHIINDNKNNNDNNNNNNNNNYNIYNYNSNNSNNYDNNNDYNYNYNYSSNNNINNNNNNNDNNSNNNNNNSDNNNNTLPEISDLPLWNAVSYTILAKCNELALNGQDILTSLNEIQISFLRSLIHSATSTNSSTHFQNCQTESCKMIDMIISFQPKMDKSEIASFLNLDAFSLLVNLQLSMPHYFSFIINGHLDPNLAICLTPTLSLHVFKLMLLFRIAQIIMLLVVKDTDSSRNAILPEYNPLLKLWSIYRNSLPKTLSTRAPMTINIDILQSELSKYIFPFLQSSALFYYLMFGVNLPFIEPTVYSLSQVDILIKYLGCDNLMSFINESIREDTQPRLLLQNWFVQCAEMSQLYTSGIPALSLIIPPYGGLIDLKENYFDILKESKQFYCPTTNNKASDVSMCLVCGKLLCTRCFACTESKKNSSTYDSLGPCCRHVIECSGSVGMVLLIRDAYVIMFSITTEPNVIVSACIRDAPFLDKFGQPDRFLRNGYPLTLSAKDYVDLKNIWLHNDIRKQIRMFNEERSIFDNIQLEWHFY